MTSRGLLGGTLTRVLEEYRRHGLAEAAATFEVLRAEDPRLRAVTGWLERIVPLTQMADEIVYYDELLGRDGLGPGSRRALERWDLFPRVEMHGSAWTVLESRPFLAFGNHPAGIEVAFFNALLNRDDVYFVAGDFAKHAFPTMVGQVVAVDNATARVHADSPPGMRDRFLRGVETRLSKPGDRPAAKVQNQRAIERVAELIGHQGAGVHLFPAGSSRSEASWRRGIGQIVGDLVRRGSSAAPVSLVPVVYDVRKLHLMASALFPRQSPLRRLAQVRVWSWTGPPSVFVPRPVPLGELGLDGTESPEVVTGVLHELWKSTASQAQAAIPRWTPLHAARAWKSQQP